MYRSIYKYLRVMNGQWDQESRASTGEGMFGGREFMPRPK